MLNEQLDEVELLAQQMAQDLFNLGPDLTQGEELRTSEFACALIQALEGCVASQSYTHRQAMIGAARSAEALNEAQFQGIVEFMQNADDLRATEVRMGLRSTPTGAQILLVHNGRPVSARDVLPMTMPYLTTKTDEAEQRGRFGIGLKTLRRFASEVAIHSAPYHLVGDMLSFRVVSAEPGIPGFYDPAADTMIVCTLKDNASFDDAIAFVSEFTDENLIFQRALRAFSVQRIGEEPLFTRRVQISPWREVCTGKETLRRIEQCTVNSVDASWTVYRAILAVPDGIAPSYKVRTPTTTMQVAVPASPGPGRLYIGFATRVACTLPFSLDASFDPDTGRDKLIENQWNEWLITCVANVLCNAAVVTLANDPTAAWALVPLPEEGVGAQGASDWLHRRFSASLRAVPHLLASNAVNVKDAGALNQIVYEEASLAEVLQQEHMVLMRPGKTPLPATARDASNRWRRVLDAMGVSTCLRTSDLLQAFAQKLFVNQPPAWWVAAGNAIAQAYANFNSEDDDGNEDADAETSEDGRPHTPWTAPFLLDKNCQPITCVRKDRSYGAVLYGAAESYFALEWALYHRLHPQYAEVGQATVRWLQHHAAYAETADAHMDMVAFAEKHALEPAIMNDVQLRMLRDRFDLVAADRAEALGHAVGQCVLIDGYHYVAGKSVKKKVAPAQAYLCKTLDGENAHWSTAAAHTSGLDWVASRYEEELKTADGRRRTVGTPTSRGAKKFLQLLGAENVPRLVHEWRDSHDDRGLRGEDLAKVRANMVEQDVSSPDLLAVVRNIAALKKKDADARRTRSAALLRVLSRNWTRVFHPRAYVPAVELKRTRRYESGMVRARWLLDLAENAWVAVGGNNLEPPANAAIKNSATSLLYGNSTFIAGVGADELDVGMASALGIITDTKVSDLVDHLQRLRKADSTDVRAVLQVYRSLAKQCPKSPNAATVGDMPLQALRNAFNAATGLVLAAGKWSPAANMFRGPDILHEPERFVPVGAAYDALWRVLLISEPELDACIRRCVVLARGEYDSATQSALIDLYRYMERKLENQRADSRERSKMTLYCAGKWAPARNAYYVDHPELRQQLAYGWPDLAWWEPPCNVFMLERFMTEFGVVRFDTRLEVAEAARNATELGESFADRFAIAVELLADELARNMPAARAGLTIDLDTLKSLPLLVYDRPFSVHVQGKVLGRSDITVRLQALLVDRVVHISETALGEREHGGRIIASHFAEEHRRHVEAEWAVAWAASSRNTNVKGLRLAEDSSAAKMQQLAEQINASATNKSALKLSAKLQSKARAEQAQSIRRLKRGDLKLGRAEYLEGNASNAPDNGVANGSASTASSGIFDGTPSGAPSGSAGEPGRRRMHEKAPLPSNANINSKPPARREYSTAELEDYGWEVLCYALQHSEDMQLVDFRRRHGVGADGSFDWKTFVEMKATGRSMQDSVLMTTSEYDRARMKGDDFILALVYGLEDGENTEIRLFFNPVRDLRIDPLQGVRVSGFAEARSLRICLDAYSPRAEMAQK